jgi:NAD(P)-dependent dehydrogenase (short-subunit alcohol dehydrogenase family)
MNHRLIIFGASSHLIKSIPARFHDEFQVTLISREYIKTGGENIQIDGYSDHRLYEYLSEKIEKKIKSTYLYLNGVADNTIFISQEEKDIAKIIDINLFLPIRLTNFILQKHSNRENRFIFVTSSRAAQGGQGIVLYSTTKGALRNLVRSLALEYGRISQYFFTISLGLFDGGLKKLVSEKLQREMINASAIKKFVSPEEFWTTVHYISNNTAATGSTIHVDNGF